MASQQNRQALLSYDSSNDLGQGQLQREDFESEETESSSLINQDGASQVDNSINATAITSPPHHHLHHRRNARTSDSVKTMAYGAADIATGATRGVMGLAQGAAMGAANLAQGAATAVRNTLGNNPESHNLHTPLPNTQPQHNPRY